MMEEVEENIKDKGLWNVIFNTGSSDILNECPWIIDFEDDKSELFKILATEGSLSGVMNKLRMPSSLKVSRVGPYRKLHDREISLCREVFSINRPDLNSAISSFIKRSGIKGYREVTSAQTRLSLCDIPINKLIWIMNHMNFEDSDIIECMDFLNANYNDEEKIRIKNYKSFKSMVEKWHEKLSKEKSIRLNAGEIDYGDIPDETKVAGFIIRPIKTQNGFSEEGEQMMHCVSSYYNDALNDKCRVFSVMDLSGYRVSTFEIDMNYNLIQHRGISNSIPDSIINSSVLSFVSNIKRNFINLGYNKIESNRIDGDVISVDSIGNITYTGSSGAVSLDTSVADSINTALTLSQINQLDLDQCITTAHVCHMTYSIVLTTRNGSTQHISINDLVDNRVRLLMSGI